MSYRNCTFNDEKGCVDIQKIDITGLIEPSGIVFDKFVYFPAGLTGSTGSFSSLSVQSSSIQPNATLVVKDVPSGQATYHIPKANATNYQPMTQSNCQQIVASGTAGSNTQTLEIIPHCSQNCGIRLQSSGIPYAMIGAGGTTSDPDVRIEMNRSGGLMQMFYTNLQLTTTSSLPNVSSGSSGRFLPITINGVNYKIALMLE